MATTGSKIDGLWLLARQPFVFTQAPRLAHECKWEVFGSGRAGCLLCGAIHVCDSLTCKQQISTDDSLLCAITGVFLNKIYGIETWSDRSICGSLERKNKTELSYDIETHLHDLLLSSNARAYAQFEQTTYLARASSFLEHRVAHACECVADVLADVVRGVPWRIPLEFCALQRAQLVKTCVAAVAPSAGMLFRNKHFKVCRSNQKAIVFGLVYLLRTGVTNETQVVLPMVPGLCAVLPLEIHLKAYFGINPSSLTDTENRLKFVIRQSRS